MTNGNFPKFYDVWQPWKSGPGCVAALETTQKIKMLIRSYTPRKIFGIFTHILRISHLGKLLKLMFLNVD